MTTMIFCDRCDEIISKELKGKSIVRFHDMIEVIGNRGRYVGAQTHLRRSFHLCEPCTTQTIEFITKKVKV